MDEVLGMEDVKERLAAIKADILKSLIVHRIYDLTQTDSHIMADYLVAALLEKAVEVNISILRKDKSIEDFKER